MWLREWEEGGWMAACRLLSSDLSGISCRSGKGTVRCWLREEGENSLDIHLHRSLTVSQLATVILKAQYDKK